MISGSTGEYSFTGEESGLPSPDLFLCEARLPYCLAFSRLASLTYSARDTVPLWLAELLRLRPLADAVLVALELLYL